MVQVCEKFSFADGAATNGSSLPATVALSPQQRPEGTRLVDRQIDESKVRVGAGGRIRGRRCLRSPVHLASRRRMVRPAASFSSCPRHALRWRIVSRRVAGRTAERWTRTGEGRLDGVLPRAGFQAFPATRKAFGLMLLVRRDKDAVSGRRVACCG